MCEREEFAPPSLPAFIGPRTTHRSKHVPPNDPCANVLKTTRDKVIVSIRGPTLLTVYSVKSACPKRPLVQCRPTHTEWVLETLIPAGSIPIN